MSRVAVYVDGFNLYHAIDELGRNDIKWLDLKAVAGIFLKTEDDLVNVTYFTAVLEWSKEKRHRHLQYIAALKSRGIEVIQSHFKRSFRHCRKHDRRCPFHEEKQTDVAIAIRVFDDALSLNLSRQIVVTADADQVPLFEKIREKLPDMKIEMAAPPGRLHKARDLGSLATRYHELMPGQLESCQLPRNIYDGRGRLIATRPAHYAG